MEIFKDLRCVLTAFFITEIPRSCLSLICSSSSMENKSTVNILDDIGSMFDDLADQLEAMLD